MDWGTVWSIVLGAGVGAITSIATTSLAYRRTRLDQIQDFKRSTYAQYLSAYVRFPGRVDRFESKPEDYEADLHALLKEMADFQEAISLLSPDIYEMIVNSPDIVEAEREKRHQLVADHLAKMRKAMRDDLD